MRGSSFGDSNDDPRNASITPQDINHLPGVHINVAAKAARATQSGVPMTLLQAIKTYPKAIGWSVLISTCTMEVFDIVLINSLMALPAFQFRFNERSPDGGYQISTTWQSGLSNGALVGEKTMIGSFTLLTGLIFIKFLTQSLSMLLVGEIFVGNPWGAFQTLTTTYAAEVYPSVANKTGPIGYKLPYGLRWIWPLPLLIGIALAPESPWWLVRNNRPEEAKKQVLRLTSRNQTDSGLNADETGNMMIFTNELGKANTEGTGYWDCSKDTDLRRTDIVCVVWGIQTMYGASSFTGYSTYFFEQAGLDVSSAFSMSLVRSPRTLPLGTDRHGKHLLIVGFLGIAPRSMEGAQWAIGAMILSYTFVYDMTVGPVCYSLVAEFSSTRLRNKTVM
ncbi:sugar porter family MFS transporter, partial [Aureobasidium melanogenum]